MKVAVTRRLNDGTEETMSPRSAASELVSELVDDYANGRWGHMVDQDGNPVTVELTVRVLKNPATLLVQ